MHFLGHPFPRIYTWYMYIDGSGWPFSCSTSIVATMPLNAMVYPEKPFLLDLTTETSIVTHSMFYKGSRDFLISQPLKCSQNLISFALIPALKFSYHSNLYKEAETLTPSVYYRNFWIQVN